jgi:hypothetical protein
VAFVGEDKMEAWQLTCPGKKMSMSVEEIKLATSWDGTTCHMHILNVLGMAYVGQLVKADGEGVQSAHGRTEHYVQRTMMAAYLLHRHFNTAEGRMALFLMRNRRGAIPRGTQVMLLRYGLNKLGGHWHRCPSNPNPKPFNGATIPSLSSGLYSAAKLFGHTGDISTYHLNESKILKAWASANGVLLKRLWKACKTHRFGWNFECSEVLIVNSTVMLPMLHKLRVCTNKPNKLVMQIWSVLSCRYSMSGYAARAIMNRHLFAPVTFALSMCTCWETRKLCEIVGDAAEKLFPKDYILDHLQEFRPQWKGNIQKWKKSQEDKVTEVEQVHSPS